MDFTGVFPYNNEYLVMESLPNIATILAFVVFFIVMILVLRYGFLFIAGFFLLQKEKRALKNRTKMLAELILMKDIQTELEKEIEQATLKAAFQN